MQMYKKNEAAIEIFGKITNKKIPSSCKYETWMFLPRLHFFALGNGRQKKHSSKRRCFFQKKL